MTLLWPSGLLLLTLFPVILAAHLFFHDKRSITVASLMFWPRQDPQQQRRFRVRAVLTPSLLLQTLALAALAVALAQPEITAAAPETEKQIVICIDVSASTQARYRSGTRSDKIKQEAIRFAQGHRDDRRVIVAFAQTPTVAAVLSPGERSAADVISGLAPTDERTDLASAVAFGESRGEGGDYELHIFTDGATDLPDGIIDTRRDVIHITPPSAETSDDGNVGIIAAEAVRGEDGAPLTLFARIANYSNEEQKRSVLFLIDDEPVRTQEIVVPSGETTTALLQAADRPFVSAVVELGPADTLAVDDSAYLSGTELSPVSITIVGPGNPFLETALQEIPGARVQMRSRYSPAIATDIVVLDRQNGISIPTGRILAVDSWLPGIHSAAVSASGAVGTVVPSDTHPVAAGIRVENAYFDTLWTNERTPGRLGILFFGNALAAFSVETRDIRAVSLNFDTTRTNLVLSAAFPVLIHNAVAWLAESADRSWNVQTGDTVPLDFERSIYADTSKIGFTAMPGQKALVGVNLFDKSESDIRPRIDPPASTLLPSSQLTTRVFFWPWFVGAAALLLFVDALLWSRKR